MTKISIITICYNEPNLEKTCQSIVNQTWQDFEWIVVDGGSNQETLDIFDKYKTRINKFVSESDNGIYNACNKGIKMAEGEYVIFKNAGDSFYNENTLKAVYSLIEKENADVVYGEIEYFYSANSKKNVLSHFPQIITSDYFIAGQNICSQGAFIKKELFTIYGGFKEEYKISADYHKWIQFTKAGKVFKYIPVIVAHYDMNGTSNNFKKVLEKEIDEVLLEYFSQEEINKAKEKRKDKYSFWENILSVKNNKLETHKIITLFGLHIKIRRK